MSEYPIGNKITTKKSKLESSPNIKYHESFDISKLYTTSGLYIENVNHLDNTLHLFCKSSDSSSVCAYCGYKSKHVHSRYQRDVHDLSILGNEIFRYPRRTRRCETAIIRQGLSVSFGLGVKDYRMEP